MNWLYFFWEFSDKSNPSHINRHAYDPDIIAYYIKKYPDAVELYKNDIISAINTRNENKFSLVVKYIDLSPKLLETLISQIDLALKADSIEFLEIYKIFNSADAADKLTYILRNLSDELLKQSLAHVIKGNYNSKKVSKIILSGDEENNQRIMALITKDLLPQYSGHMVRLVSFIPQLYDSVFLALYKNAKGYIEKKDLNNINLIFHCIKNHEEPLQDLAIWLMQDLINSMNEDRFIDNLTFLLKSFFSIEIIQSLSAEDIYSLIEDDILEKIELYILEYQEEKLNSLFLILKRGPEINKLFEDVILKLIEKKDKDTIVKLMEFTMNFPTTYLVLNDITLKILKKLSGKNLNFLLECFADAPFYLSNININFIKKLDINTDEEEINRFINIFNQIGEIDKEIKGFLVNDLNEKTNFLANSIKDNVGILPTLFDIFKKVNVLRNVLNYKEDGDTPLTLALTSQDHYAIDIILYFANKNKADCKIILSLIAKEFLESADLMLISNAITAIRRANLEEKFWQLVKDQVKKPFALGEGITKYLQDMENNNIAEFNLIINRIDQVGILKLILTRALVNVIKSVNEIKSISDFLNKILPLIKDQKEFKKITIKIMNELFQENNLSLERRIFYFIIALEENNIHIEIQESAELKTNLVNRFINILNTDNINKVREAIELASSLNIIEDIIKKTEDRATQPRVGALLFNSLTTAIRDSNLNEIKNILRNMNQFQVINSVLIGLNNISRLDLIKNKQIFLMVISSIKHLKNFDHAISVLLAKMIEEISSEDMKQSLLYLSQAIFIKGIMFRGITKMLHNKLDNYELNELSRMLITLKETKLLKDVIPIFKAQEFLPLVLDKLEDILVSNTAEALPIIRLLNIQKEVAKILSYESRAKIARGLVRLLKLNLDNNLILRYLTLSTENLYLLDDVVSLLIEDYNIHIITLLIQNVKDKNYIQKLINPLFVDKRFWHEDVNGGVDFLEVYQSFFNKIPDQFLLRYINILSFAVHTWSYDNILLVTRSLENLDLLKRTSILLKNDHSKIKHIISICETYFLTETFQVITFLKKMDVINDFADAIKTSKNLHLIKHQLGLILSNKINTNQNRDILKLLKVIGSFNVLDDVLEENTEVLNKIIEINNKPIFRMILNSVDKESRIFNLIFSKLKVLVLNDIIPQVTYRAEQQNNNLALVPVTADVPIYDYRDDIVVACYLVKTISENVQVISYFNQTIPSFIFSPIRNLQFWNIVSRPEMIFGINIVSTIAVATLRFDSSVISIKDFGGIMGVHSISIGSKLMLNEMVKDRMEYVITNARDVSTFSNYLEEFGDVLFDSFIANTAISAMSYYIAYNEVRFALPIYYGLSSVMFVGLVAYDAINSIDYVRHTSEEFILGANRIIIAGMIINEFIANPSSSGIDAIYKGAIYLNAAVSIDYTLNLFLKNTIPNSIKNYLDGFLDFTRELIIMGGGNDEFQHNLYL